MLLDGVVCVLLGFVDFVGGRLLFVLAEVVVDEVFRVGWVWGVES